jgi:hypothetical protein
MSREERRAYKRMTKNQDPYALPARTGGTAAAARRRGRRTTTPSGPFTFVTGRFLVWTIGGAVVAGLLGFSFAWPNGMPLAMYIGLAVGAVWGLLAIGFRFLQRRMSTMQR